MQYDFKVFVGNSEKKIFLKPGFYPRKGTLSPLHRHRYAEVHVVAKGEISYWIDHKKYCLEEGNVLLIPSQTYHNITDCNEDALSCAFGIEYDCKNVVMKYINMEIIRNLINEIQEIGEIKINAKIFSHLLLICSYLMDDLSVTTEDVTDNEYLISEFFSERYHENVQVSDLADELHLSEKQTQLLVKRHTGKTFKQELTEYRMKVANYLMNSTDMSMMDIANRVGFQTYSGFWKVFKAYQDEMIFLTEDDR